MIPLKANTYNNSWFDICTTFLSSYLLLFFRHSRCHGGGGGAADAANDDDDDDDIAFGLRLRAGGHGERLRAQRLPGYGLRAELRGGRGRRR